MSVTGFTHSGLAGGRRGAEPLIGAEGVWARHDVASTNSLGRILPVVLLLMANLPAFAQSNPAAPVIQNRSTGYEAHSTYAIGPKDEITVQALHVPEMDGRPILVDASGGIDLPVVGRLQAAGLTVDELRLRVRERLSEYVQEPQVRVAIVAFRSRSVSVLGAVKSPGVVFLQGPTGLPTVLSLAGGLTSDAGDTVQVKRESSCGVELPGAQADGSGRLLATLRVSRLLSAAQTQEIQVCAGDVISVPLARHVYVVGEVRKPGGFPLRDNETLSVLQALALAEGPLRTAGTKHARLLRFVPGQAARREQPVDLGRMLAGKQPDMHLSADDILFVPNNAAKSATLRAIEAAVQMGTGVVIWRR